MAILGLPRRVRRSALANVHRAASVATDCAAHFTASLPRDALVALRGDACTSEREAFATATTAVARALSVVDGDPVKMTQLAMACDEYVRSYRAALSRIADVMKATKAPPA